INSLKEKYNKEEDFYKKSYYLKSIIENYIRIKDFLYALKYIEKYIKEELENCNLIKNLKEDLTELILEVKNKLKFYNDRNILLLYIDSLRSVDLMKFNRMKFLREFAKENTYYSKAYSTSIYTYESFMPTLKEEDVLINKNYELINVNENECKCVKKAINQGFSFNLYSGSSSYFINGDNVNIKNGGQYISEAFWEYVTNLNSDSISLLYVLSEVHLPHVGGEHDGRDIKIIRALFSEIDSEPIDEDKYISQYEKSLKYVDEQLKFYLNMFNNDADIFIFSDHGQIIEGIGEGLEKLETKLGSHEDRINIPLIVKSKYFEKEINKDIVSLMDFNNIVCSLIDKNSFLPNRKYAKVALSPVHNKNMRYNFKKYNKDEYLNGFEVFIFQDFKIVVTSDGTIKGYHIENFNEYEEYNKDILKKYYEYVKDDILVTKAF
ncbi:sulfatase-like hydrolase/transferase, partial [Clostridium argentinense]